MAVSLRTTRLVRLALTNSLLLRLPGVVGLAQPRPALLARPASLRWRCVVADAAVETPPAPAEAAACLLYTSPSPRDRTRSRMPSSA